MLSLQNKVKKLILERNKLKKRIRALKEEEVLLELFRSEIGKHYNDIPLLIRKLCYLVYNLKRKAKNNRKEIFQKNFSINEVSFVSKGAIIFNYSLGKKKEKAIKKTFVLKAGKFKGKLIVYCNQKPTKEVLGLIEKLLEYSNKALKRHFLMFSDSLTGFYSRGILERMFFSIDSYLERNPKNNIALFFLDIDGFKDINDVFGHAFGDTILKEVSNVIKKAMRKTDVLLRYGGDEIIIFAYLGEKQDTITPIAKLSLRLTEAVQNYFKKRLDGLLSSSNISTMQKAKIIKAKRDHLITVSVGATLFIKGEGNFLISKTDSASYLAKGRLAFREKFFCENNTETIKIKGGSNAVIFLNGKFYLVKKEEQKFFLHKICNVSGNEIVFAKEPDFSL
jgi:diguanylate cyclase (GGDEF)-like protein